MRCACDLGCRFGALKFRQPRHTNGVEFPHGRPFEFPHGPQMTLQDLTDLLLEAKKCCQARSVRLKARWQCYIYSSQRVQVSAYRRASSENPEYVWCLSPMSFRTRYLDPLARFDTVAGPAHNFNQGLMSRHLLHIRQLQNLHLKNCNSMPAATSSPTSYCNLTWDTIPQPSGLTMYRKAA